MVTGCHHLNSSSETSLEQYSTIKCLLYPTSRISQISDMGFLLVFYAVLKIWGINVKTV